MTTRTITTIAALGFGLAAAISTATADELKLGYSLGPDSHYGQGAHAMAAKLAELSDGKWTIEEFPANALGGEREMVEGAQIGTVDLVITSTGPVGNFVPETLITDIPFLFTDYDHAHAVLDGPIGQEILDKFPDNGIVALAWGENGFRNLTNSQRAVRTPEDAKGLKIRTMENQVHMKAFETLGVLPTPMAFPELFTALQQGTVDGQENPVGVIVNANFSEVQDYLSLTQHVYSPALIIISGSIWDGLSDEEKGWFKEAALAGGKAMREKAEADADAGIATLKEQGMTVVEDVDTAAFQQALEPAYEAYAEQFGKENIDRIRNYGQ
ncbi:TRAP transporter substrate-binding protein [Amorphus coralli]|uniref:TRAP transporter substrate-binding protein n=1 Tax=Amorphus coralli TaxID=340680 RepID=UPI00036CF0F3|nr:TRAP transporter substrate-binding protein [Amorphus coralli]